MSRPTILTHAIPVEWKGKTLIICADDVETLTAYLGVQGHAGYPEARQVALVMGPTHKPETTTEHEDQSQG